MRLMAFLLIVALAIGGFYLFDLRENSHSERGDELSSSPSAADPCECEVKTPDYVKSLSCSSTACHGAIHPAETDTGLLRNEYRIWFDSDPHANAARVLGNAVSQQMVEHLVRRSSAPDKYQKVYERCLACHNTTGAEPPNELVETPAWFDQDDSFEGVGCEMCHGPASEWKNIHYFDCWKEFSVEEKKDRGLEDTKTLSERAKLCVRCHVGETGRDVDHDLIAAGHPQMKFEMLGYHTLMPHHWNDRRDERASFETDLWAAGQTASAAAALALLEIRADRVSKTKDEEADKPAWPEFSEYDCFACHHDLHDATWRRDRGFTPNNRRVLLPWGVWHFALLPELVSADDAKGQEFAQALGTLEATMEGTLSPEADLVKAQAAQAREALENWIPHGPSSPLASRLSPFLDEQEASGLKLRNWDDAVQLYLAAYAVLKSQSRAANEPQGVWAKDAEEARKGLGFSPDYQSPRDFPLAASPREQEKDEVRNRLGKMFKHLPEHPP
jgi:hypothetical protein